MIPLRRKLVSINLAILIMAIAAFGTTTYRGLVSFAEKYTKLNLERSGSVKESYRKISNENIQKIRLIYEQNLKTKGFQLLSKDSSSITPMIADNSFLGVAQFLQRTFEDDKDIRLASYFIADGKEVRAWHFASSDHKHGLPDYKHGHPSPLTYNLAKKSWETKIDNDKTLTISDPSILNIIKNDTKSVKFQEYILNGKKLFGFDCVIPFFEGLSGPAVKAAKKKGEAIGYLRYILSPEEMNRAISAEKATLEERLRSLEGENQQAFKQSQEIVAESSKKVLKTLTIVAILIILSGSLASLFSATTISRPVKFLTRIAGNMAKGEYVQTIHQKSNDEIGILASAFQKMSIAIQKRDEELADINRNLETTIELRSLQLKDENKKISALLNNMKQAVFAVSSDYRVVPPVSKFSSEVFKETIEGKSIFDSIYNGIDPKSEEMASLKSALISVFDSDELQWNVMEESFPRRIEIKGKIENEKTEVRVLRINYSALYSENLLLNKILMVVEDITELEKLEMEVRIQQQKSEILSQLTESNLDVVKGYFITAGKMLNEIAQILRNKNPSAAMIGTIFRHLHTIKGNSRSLEFMSVAKISHEVENEAESIKKYLILPGSTSIPEEELTRLREGIASIRSAIEKYLKIAAQIFGIESDLAAKRSSEFHEKMIDSSWDNSNQQSKIPILAAIAQELGFNGLSKKITQLGSQETSTITQENWLKLMPEIVYSVYKSPLFVEHSHLQGIWGHLGLKIWEVSAALERLKKSGLNIHELNLTIEKIRNGWSYASASGLYYYAEYFNKLESLLLISKLEETLPIETNIWRQYLLTAKLHNAHKLEPDELTALNIKLTQLSKAENPDERSLKSLAEYDTWITPLFYSLIRSNLNINTFLKIWASRLGYSINELINKFTDIDSANATKPSDFLFDFLGQSEKLNWRAFLNQLDDKSLPECSNLYLFWLDICQILAGLSEIPELMKGRYRTVEVLTMNINQLKESLISQLGNQNVPSDVIQFIEHSVEKLMEIPLKPALWAYKPMIESTAKILGKQIELTVKGDDVTLDRKVLYKIQSALVHLIRNTIDHGIETPEIRKKTNKFTRGKLTIECKNAIHSNIIRFSDDGGGIDHNKIAAIAIKRGIIKESDVTLLSDAEKLELIFIPGFSSNDSVTELSGRGVGLDVVKNNIESLGGKILVSTDIGLRTTFEIMIPTQDKSTMQPTLPAIEDKTQDS